jgi:hypothetical protein
MTGDFLHDLARDPQAFPFKFDLPGQRVLVVRLSDSQIRAASFLDERLLGAQSQGGWIPLDALLQESSLSAPPVPAAVFHIGHCGSTLLSRLLDGLGTALGLREPLVLRALAEHAERLDSPTARLSRGQWLQLFRNTTGWLQRRGAGATRTVVKATSSCNVLIEPWLQADAVATAVALHVDLSSYLLTMLKADSSRQDAETFIAQRLGFLHRALGDERLRLYELDQAQRIALGWFAEMLRFERLAQRWPARLLQLDFAELLADPAQQLLAVAKHLQLDADSQSVQRALAAGITGRYSKATEHAYGPADRQADLEAARGRFGGEFDSAMRFADALLTNYTSLQGLAAKIGPR